MYMVCMHVYGVYACIWCVCMYMVCMHVHVVLITLHVVQQDCQGNGHGFSIAICSTDRALTALSVRSGYYCENINFIVKTSFLLQ